MQRIAVITAMGLAASGCASTIQSVTDRAIMSDGLEADEDGSKIKSMSGDRRLIRVVNSQYKAQIIPQPNNLPATSRVVGQHLVCAETHADAISIRTSKGSITGAATLPVTGANDEIGGSLEKVFDRTAEADLFRQAAWQLCNSYANGVLTRAEYANSLTGLVDSVSTRLAAKTENNLTEGDVQPTEEQCKKKPDTKGCKKQAAVATR